ncbi:MAG TPA: DinB family protein [Candidatus Kapabacteria bacterium]|nr:DinB family protein [Candidatus Kapabacteria bacterium]
MTAEDVRGRFSWLEYTERATAKMMEMIPEDAWDFRPAEGCRTVGELAAHLYGAERATLLGLERGSMTQEEYSRDQGPAIAARKDVHDLMESARQARARVLESLTDESLNVPIKLFYGEFTAAQVIGFVYDEHWHHRGQLTVYLRALGLEPPFIYGE